MNRYIPDKRHDLAADAETMLAGLNGGAAPESVGDPYNLKKLEDFEGVYAAAGAGATVGAGGGAVSMRNDKGVVMNLGGTSAGVDLRLAVSGMNIKLVE